jgi:hypothetical protein
VSWYVPALRKAAIADRWHPLGAAAEPWPSAPWREPAPLPAPSPAPAPLPAPVSVAQPET